MAKNRWVYSCVFVFERERQYKERGGAKERERERERRDSIKSLINLGLIKLYCSKKISFALAEILFQPKTIQTLHISNYTANVACFFIRLRQTDGQMT